MNNRRNSMMNQNKKDSLISKINIQGNINEKRRIKKPRISTAIVNSYNKNKNEEIFKIMEEVICDNKNFDSNQVKQQYSGFDS